MTVDQVVVRLLVSQILLVVYSTRYVCVGFSSLSARLRACCSDMCNTGVKSLPVELYVFVVRGTFALVLHYIVHNSLRACSTYT